MRKSKLRHQQKSGYESEKRIKRVDANKELSKNWKRFLEMEDFDD